MPLDYVRDRFQQTLDDPRNSFIVNQFELDYQQLEASSKVIGVWDDHDFGINNGNFMYEGKYLTRDIYLDFIKEPMDSKRRIEKHRGLY